MHQMSQVLHTCGELSCSWDLLSPPVQMDASLNPELAQAWCQLGALLYSRWYHLSWAFPCHVGMSDGGARRDFLRAGRGLEQLSEMASVLAFLLLLHFMATTDPFLWMIAVTPGRPWQAGGIREIMQSVRTGMCLSTITQKFKQLHFL